MPSDGEVQTLVPLTNDLIAAVLSTRGYNFSTDDDGDIGGVWNDNVVYFLRQGATGEALQVRTIVATGFTVDDVPRLYAFCNEWNHDRLWPKAYVHVNDDGTARVVGEVMADLSRGVSHPQLDQIIRCGISTGSQLAEAAAELAA
ncbi:YbjN domain-containing protein [Catellatospora sp. KI3]|uniref:YbjN domain-containing protein n=1 Tax=Catellatospora sp. KI3 TaxID=3041620 RepID=UPI002482F347|nr:YbjN domain-containing protein [Catellatospora sp. KI3]MDI1460939.1 YbjN domain-containing protein [Catellatospora sp. KI3]